LRLTTGIRQTSRQVVSYTSWRLAVIRIACTQLHHTIRFQRLGLYQTSTALRLIWLRQIKGDGKQRPYSKKKDTERSLLCIYYLHQKKDSATFPQKLPYYQKKYFSQVMLHTAQNTFGRSTIFYRAVLTSLHTG